MINFNQNRAWSSGGHSSIDSLLRNDRFLWNSSLKLWRPSLNWFLIKKLWFSIKMKPGVSEATSEMIVNSKRTNFVYKCKDVQPHMYICSHLANTCIHTLHALTRTPPLTGCLRWTIGSSRSLMSNHFVEHLFFFLLLFQFVKSAHHPLFLSFPEI